VAEIICESKLKQDFYFFKQIVRPLEEAACTASPGHAVEYLPELGDRRTCCNKYGELIIVK
jgi:hypothetical protein